MYSASAQRVTQLEVAREVGGQLLLRPSLFATMVTRPVSLLTRASTNPAPRCCRPAPFQTSCFAELLLAAAAAAAAAAVTGLPAPAAGVRTNTRNRGAISADRTNRTPAFTKERHDVPHDSRGGQAN